MYGQFFVLFALVFTGYFLRKVQVIDHGMADGLHKFISYFAFPCLLVYKIGTLDMTSGLATQLLIITLLSCGLFVLYSDQGLDRCDPTDSQSQHFGHGGRICHLFRPHFIE